MRNELELMETIEKYLNGSLSEAEKNAFEKKIDSDPELQKEVQLQKELMQGINRVAIKQSAKQSFKKYKFNKNLKNWGLTGLTIAVLATSSVFLYKTISKDARGENAPNELPELNEQGNKLWSDADRYLPLQNFDINTEKDTVIETKDGIVFAIPAHSFLDANGQPAKGNVQLEIKEALKAADIMKAGLTTKSGDKLLETGGMFYINARQDDASLKIDPKNALYAEIPTDEVKPGMQLFTGKRLPNGTIDWVDPKPIQKDLIPVDILSLDFYPPNYIDSLKKWGYNTKDKKFTDSLYYAFSQIFNTTSLSAQLGSKKDTVKTDSIARPNSIYWVLRNKKTNKLETFSNSQFSSLLHWNEQYDYESAYYNNEDPGKKIFKQNCAACHSLGSNKITGPGLANIMTRVPSGEWLHSWIKNNKSLISAGDAYANEVYNQNKKADMTVFAGTLSDDDIKMVVDYIKNSNQSSTEGINPAKIKTIWSQDFENTLIATREFEERLPFIFNTCDENVLDLYIDNLDKNLSTIDSLAYSQSNKKEFLEFAARGDGKVKNGNKNVELLKKYFREKSQAYTEAIQKTKKEFWEKQSELDVQARIKKTDHSDKDIQRLNENFKKELDLNLDEAYRQLGRKRPTPTASAPYGVHVATTGWLNVDAYVIEATTNRTSLNYTDPENGKKAEIKYESLSVTVKDLQNYDRVLVYLLPDELNSFMRVENKNNVFEEKLNELMVYKIVCIAYKGEESFYFSQDNVKPGSLTVSLIQTSNAIIKNNVNQLGKKSQAKAMTDELNYIAFEKEEVKRQQQITKINELTNKIRPVIFPCMASAAAPDDTPREIQ
jgi:mono/diheme cytochrome c family protein